MDTKTHGRGPLDTKNGRFAKVLGVSLLLHLPFTPWAALVGLLRIWSPPSEEVSSPPITGIPIDVIEDPLPSPVAAAPPEPPAESAAGEALPATPRPAKKPSAPKLADAGAEDAGLEDAGPGDAGPADDAGAADASAKLAKADDAGLADAGADDAGLSVDAGAKPIEDPSVAAGVKRVADPNANVRITLYTQKIRANPLGARLGPLLGSLYQWRDFFGPAGIDPIRDIDQIYIVGPQLRDSSNVVAVIKHHLPAPRMRAALNRLVELDRAGGEWLDAGLPVASAHADGAERRFVLANSETVVVTPPSAYAATLAAGKMLHLVTTKTPEVALVYLATPWRAFLGFPVRVPQSIHWARIRVTPTDSGGALAEIDAEDESPARASEDAEYLTRTANALSQLDLGFLGSLLGQSSHRFIDHVEFHADGDVIRGSASVSAAQLGTILDMAGAFLAERPARRARPLPSAQP